MATPVLASDPIPLENFAQARNLRLLASGFRLQLLILCLGPVHLPRQILIPVLKALDLTGLILVGRKQRSDMFQNGIPVGARRSGDVAGCAIKFLLDKGFFCILDLGVGHNPDRHPAPALHQAGDVLDARILDRDGYREFAREETYVLAKTRLPKPTRPERDLFDGIPDERS